MAAKRLHAPDVGPFGPEHFRWPVCPDGYRWETRLTVPLGQDLLDAERRLVLLPASEAEAESNPLGDPALFRKLAEMSTTEDGIRAFADEHGQLDAPGDRLGGVLVRVAAAGSDLFTAADELGVTFSDWAAHVAQLRAAVGILDALAGPEPGDVSPWVWTDRGGRPGARPGEWYLAYADDQGKTYPAVHLAEHPDGEPGPIDRPTAGRRLLAQVINQNLYTLRMAPRNLLGACWWQVARLLTGTATHRPCKVCGRPIEISTDGEGFRADRELCSPACKAKDHRARVRQAKALQAEGKSVREIADQLEKPTSIIKNWLTKRK
jgi:hypothetical protein